MGVVLALAPTTAEALGKKPFSPPSETTPRTRKPIGLATVKQEGIELPDGKRWEFGQDFEARLSSVLTQSGEFRVVDETPAGVDPKERLQASQRLARASESEDPWVWAGSITPAVRVRFHTEALSFVTGSRGERVMYGFDSRRPLESVEGKEEFPLRELTFEANWFDRHFEPRGVAPFDSVAGLDLGDGFKLDAIFAFFTYKQARYRARLELRMEVEPGHTGEIQTRRVGVSGEGFFFDVAGGYLQYSAGIRIARTDAVLQVFKRAIEATQGEIQEAVAAAPLLAKVDGVLPEERLIFLGTGPDSGVPAGVRFRIGEGIELEVERSLRSGSIARVVEGKFEDVAVGQLAVEHPKTSPLLSLQAARVAPAASAREIQLPRVDLAKTDLQGTVPAESWLQALWKSITDAALLPYRIWRSYQYDQTYRREADAGESLAQFLAKQQATSWARQLGLGAAASASEGPAPVVAILDTGLDYNHPVTHDSLWLNPTPVKDSQGRSDFYGWDFVSGDARPFDDHDRGTELASLVLTVAPHARILPLKVFNPFGITSKGSLRAAFDYAIGKRVDVILCGWATRRNAETFQEAVRAAREAGILVIAAAGDRGDDLDSVEAFPAALARAEPETVLAVAALDKTGEHLVQNSGHFSNGSSALVRLAAPGEGLRVARPRGRFGVGTPSTAYAAALVAGAAARLGSGIPGPTRMSRLLAAARSVPSLNASVQEGRRLFVGSLPQPER